MPEFDLRKIRAGDHETFDRLYARYAARVLGYLLRMGTPRAEAEDLLQDTFLAAYAGRAGLRGDCLPLAWLLGIARRRRRDGQRRAVLPTHSLSDRPDLPEGGMPSLADRVVGAAALDVALGRLGEAEREALLLTACEGLTYKEAASVLGEPIGTLKWRVHKALVKLRQILAAEESNEDAVSGQQSAGAPPTHPSGGRGSRPSGSLETAPPDRP